MCSVPISFLLGSVCFSGKSARLGAGGPSAYPCLAPGSDALCDLEGLSSASDKLWCAKGIAYGNVEGIKLGTNVKTFEGVEVATAETMTWLFVHCLSFTLKLGLEVSIG